MMHGIYGSDTWAIKAGPELMVRRMCGVSRNEL